MNQSQDNNAITVIVQSWNYWSYWNIGIVQWIERKYQKIT